MNMLALKVKRLDLIYARMPERAHPSDAGIDLFSSDFVVLAPGIPVRVATGLAMAIPDGWYGQVRDRSSMAAKGVTVSAGVIDSEYRGEVAVLLTNHTTELFHVEHGDRVAQLTLHLVPAVEIYEVADLPPSDRGEGGFGSTGR